MVSTVSLQVYTDKQMPLWPLYIHRPPETPGLPLRCGLTDGDAVLYAGHDLPHSRKKMPQELGMLGSLSLYYVPPGFDFFGANIKSPK